MPPPVALFVIDPPERLDPPTDTSLALMRASLKRGLQVVYCTLSDLRLEAQGAKARVRPVDFVPGQEVFNSGPPFDLDLQSLAVLFMRKDPPVDMAYLEACAVLDFLPSGTVQINPVRALRLHGEKIIPFHFAHLMPETLVSADAADLQQFLARHEKIVIKPLADCSGRGIFILERNIPGTAERLRTATGNGSQFVQAQQFLPAITAGDKRVLLLGGEILGWVRRVPAVGDFRSNINAGGRCVPCDLTEADRAICSQLQPWLVREGIHLAGADLVDGRLLEVNITSPSCLREINNLTGSALEERILDYVLGLCGQRRP